jgi:hypothetical protein
VLEWQDQLSNLARLPRRVPFDPVAVSVVGTLSQRLLRSGVGRQFPDLAALAHWFRPARLREMSARVLESTQDRILPRGLVFAMAPANIELLFAYVWLLSLLSGNSTIVRVSSKPSQSRDRFLAAMREVTTGHEGMAVVADSWVLTYDHQVAYTKAISEVCHARLVWGGNATIAAVRSVPLNPLALEVSFADRFSLAAFDAETVCEVTHVGLKDVARRLAADTLWAAQQACSSPRVLVWVGEPGRVAEAQDRLWPEFAEAAGQFDDDPGASIRRITDVFSLAAEGAVNSLLAPLAQFPARAAGSGTDLAQVRRLHSGNGLFVEYAVPGIADVAALLGETDQTLVAYGFAEDAIEDLVSRLPSRAIDRIVAPGQATNFSSVWDGTDLFGVLTRRIQINV